MACTGRFSGQAAAALRSMGSRSVGPLRPAPARSSSVSRRICTGASSTARTWGWALRSRLSISSRRWRRSCCWRQAQAFSPTTCTSARAARPQRIGRHCGDRSRSQAEIQAKLTADPTIDGVFALNADIATGGAIPAAAAAGRKITIGTVDLSGDAVTAIKDGKLAFAIDQQQFAQGYLSVSVLYLNLLNGHVLGGGQPIYTGPGFVTKDNADLVQKLAAAGTR